MKRRLINEQMSEQVNKQMNEWTSVRVNGPNKWKNERMTD